MKKLVTTLVLFIAVSMAGQSINPEKITAKDEFGDPTGGLHYYAFKGIEGGFSNSATSGDSLYVTIMVSESFIAIDMKEYKKKSASVSFNSPKNGTIAIKTPEGKKDLMANGTMILRNLTDEEYVKSMKVHGWSEKKSLKFRSKHPDLDRDDSYEYLLDALRDGGAITMVLYERNLAQVGNSTYKFSFVTEPSVLEW